jgi:hypothetical protein
VEGKRRCNAHRLTCIFSAACCDRSVIQRAKTDETYFEWNRAVSASRNIRSIKNVADRPFSAPMMSPTEWIFSHAISPSLSSASTWSRSSCSALGVEDFERLRSRRRLRTEDCHDILSRARAAHGRSEMVVRRSGQESSLLLTLSSMSGGVSTANLK